MQKQSRSPETAHGTYMSSRYHIDQNTKINIENKVTMRKTYKRIDLTTDENPSIN
jgi:hypothetical protein